jgi:integrative and conjugative element protein (TIGR02256 family)
MHTRMTGNDTVGTAASDLASEARGGRQSDGEQPDGVVLELPRILPVTLSSAAASSIAQHSAASADGLETGGLLLGHIEIDRVVVHFAGGPGPGALREPTRFQRDLGHAQELADAAWKLNRSIWLGDWHTHPNASAAPSDTDMQTYQRHLTDPDLTLPTFLSLIALADDWTSAQVVAWTVALAEDGPDEQIAVAVITDLTVTADMRMKDKM